MTLNYKIIPVTPFLQNCSLLWCDQTMQGVVVDPGGDIPAIEKMVEQEGVQATKILLTHGHVDHVGGAVALSKKLNIPIEGSQEADKFWFDILLEQSQKFGLPPVTNFLPDQWLSDGDTILVGQESLDVLHCPGHTPGHIAFFSMSAKLAVVGDVLFAGSVGRTDFPHSSYEALISSIRNKLWPLGDEVRFIPGHGSMSSIGTERKNNPFARDKAF